MTSRRSRSRRVAVAPGVGPGGRTDAGCRAGLRCCGSERDLGGASGTWGVSDGREARRDERGWGCGEGRGGGEPGLSRAYAAGVARGARQLQCSAEESGVQAFAAADAGGAVVAGPGAVRPHGGGHGRDREVDLSAAVAVGASTTPAAGALRLAHRALETHARDVGYQAERGLIGPGLRGRAACSESCGGTGAARHARVAAVALSRDGGDRG